MRFFHPLFHFFFQIGYFGPLLLGTLDSSFLVLPFGNDLLVVGLVAQHRHGVALYVLAAACGSTIGVLVLALVCRKLGEEGIKKLAGEKRFEKLKAHIGAHAGPAVALGALAPPPFPYTILVGAAAALDYSMLRLLTVNFFARAARFSIVAWLALKFGRQVIAIAKSNPFEWGMGVFIFLCVAASALSIWNWLRKTRR